MFGSKYLIAALVVALLGAGGYILYQRADVATAASDAKVARQQAHEANAAADQAQQRFNDINGRLDRLSKSLHDMEAIDAQRQHQINQIRSTFNDAIHKFQAQPDDGCLDRDMPAAALRMLDATPQGSGHDRRSDGVPGAGGTEPAASAAAAGQHVPGGAGIRGRQQKGAGRVPGRQVVGEGKAREIQ